MYMILGENVQIGTLDGLSGFLGVHIVCTPSNSFGAKNMSTMKNFDLFTVKHEDFQNAFNTEMGDAEYAKYRRNIIILGGIWLYWANGKRINYLQNILIYAKKYNLRFNAIKSMIVHFTGAKGEGKGLDFQFTKAGIRKFEFPQEELLTLRTFDQWVKSQRPEPDYDAAKTVLKMVKYLEKQEELVSEADDNETYLKIQSAIAALA